MTSDRVLVVVRCGHHGDRRRPALGTVVMRDRSIIYVPKLDRSRIRGIHEQWIEPGVAEWTVDDLAADVDLSAGYWPLVYCHTHGPLTAPGLGGDVNLLEVAIEAAQAHYSGGPRSAEVIIK